MKNIKRVAIVKLNLTYRCAIFYVTERVLSVPSFMPFFKSKTIILLSQELSKTIRYACLEKMREFYVPVQYFLNLLFVNIFLSRLSKNILEI